MFIAFMISRWRLAALTLLPVLFLLVETACQRVPLLAPSGSVIADAKASATNTATGVRYASTSNGSGDYILPFLIPGEYSITVESKGFRTSNRAGVMVRESDRVTIDTTMEVGDAAQSVQVQAESPLLDTSTASMGIVVDRRAIADLPSKDGMVP